jgi:hypothetical protein
MTTVESIALSAGIAGVLDIAATGTVMRTQGVPFQKLLQFVASGMLGSRAFEGGGSTAAIGIVLHFLIAAAWAVNYFVLTSRVQTMLALPWAFGALYGVVVHVVMSRAVVPLSRAAKRPFAWKAWLIQLMIHMLCVGIPIAVVQTRCITGRNLRSSSECWASCRS